MSLFKDFLNLNLDMYENININFPIGAFLIILAFVFSIATFMIYLKRNAEIKFLTALIRHEAEDESSAKSLKELRLYTFPTKFFLAYSGWMKKIVAIAGREEVSCEEYLKLSKEEKKKYDRPNFSIAKLYIKPDGSEKAKNTEQNETVSILSPTLATVISFFSLFLFAQFLPDILFAVNAWLA